MEDPHQRRIRKLAARLSARSRSCPGLFLLESEDEFMALARHHGGGGAEDLALILESYDRHPAQCHQAVNQWLLSLGAPLPGLAGDAAADYRRLRRSIEAALISSCQSRRPSAA